ncbi:ATP-binding protein [Methylobacterium sp. CM6247]
MIRKEKVSQLIKELNATDETEELEAKEQSGNNISKTVYVTICALANEPDLGGGTILLGVEKEEALFPFYSPAGIKDPDKLSSDLASACSTMFNQPLRIDIRPEQIGDAIVIRIDVPELPATQKPVYFRATGLPRGAFRRIGPTDVHCTDEDLHLFYQGKGGDPFDIRIVKDASIEDIDSVALAAYRSARKEVNPLAEELNWSDEDLLFSLGAIKRFDDNIRVTNTGLLTFGKSTSLRRLFPTHRVDYVRVRGTAWFKSSDEPMESLDMRGPLMTLIPRIIAAVSDDLPRTLDVDGGRSGQRSEIPVLPYRVIRESVVNALMHRSYQTFQPIQIIRYANRIEIKNAGHSLKSQDRLGTPGSAIRNPTIAAIMHETRFAETKGSGIRVMRAQMVERGLSAPTFESDRHSDEFSATFLFHHFLNETDWNWLSSFSELKLSEEQMKALIFVREVGAINNSTYRSLTHADTLSASKSLRALREMNLLSDRGSGAKTHYIAGSEMLAREIAQNSRVKSTTSQSSSHDSDANMDASSHDKGVRLQDMPYVLRKAVVAMHLRKRVSPEQAQELIAHLCTWRALSSAELAEILDRTQVHLSQKYISPMISDGRLRYFYPEMVHHPEQKYVTDSTPIRPKSGRRRK